MNFASVTFLVFFVVVYGLWLVLDFRRGKMLLLVASLFFYAYWYPPFLFLLLGTGLVDYFCALRIKGSPGREGRWLGLSLVLNLGVLIYFKYANFFIGEADVLLSWLGFGSLGLAVQVILPMGISFYTFQSMSYTVDVYRKRIEPCTKVSDFLLYLSFFPQLVAGPIVKAVHFLPQLQTGKRLPDAAQVQDSIYRITRGLFLKVVVADNIAPAVNTIYALQLDRLSLAESWLGCLFFGIQIFCDFAGYSDMAIGLAGLLGYKLNENFNNPNFATSPSDYWKRWHISLSSWFREYVFAPLSARFRTTAGIYFSLFALFFLSGLWHGAHNKFLLWGFYHFLLMAAEMFLKKKFRGAHQALLRQPWIKPVSMVLVFILILPAWAPFRVTGPQWATFDYWQAMLGLGDSAAGTLHAPTSIMLEGLFWTLVFAAYQLVCGLKTRTGAQILAWQRVESWLYFAALLLLPGNPADFIYFQF